MPRNTENVAPVPANAFENDLNRTARHLPQTLPDAQLRTRILNALPIVAPDVPDGAGRKQLTRRAFAGAALACAAAGFGIFAGPHLFVGENDFASAATEIHAALQKVNTWHLTGWKLQNGKQVRWEVWGRRAPFFYREQIGDSITYDDGKQRVRLLGADTTAGRNRPVALKMFSKPLMEQQDGMAQNSIAQNTGSSPRFVSPDSFVEVGENAGRAWEKIKEGYDVVVLRSLVGGTIGVQDEDHYRWLTVDRKTNLPRLFEWQTDRKPRRTDAPANAFSAPAKNFVSGHLEAVYDVPIAEETTPLPANTLVIEMTAPRTENVPMVNAATAQGLTIAATAITRDRDGNLRVAYGAWLGNTKLDADATGLGIEVMVNPVRKYRNGMVVSMPNLIDEQGNVYVEISTPPRSQRSDRPERYYVPIEPISPNAPLPRTLTANLLCTLNATEIDPDTHTGSWKPLMTEPLALTLSLPNTMQDLGYDLITADDCLAPGSPRWTLKLEIAQARANYYQNQIFTAPTRVTVDSHGNQKVERLKPTPPNAYDRAMHYYQETIAEAHRTKNRMAESMARDNRDRLKSYWKK